MGFIAILAVIVIGVAWWALRNNSAPTPTPTPEPVPEPAPEPDPVIPSPIPDAGNSGGHPVYELKNPVAKAKRTRKVAATTTDEKPSPKPRKPRKKKGE